MSVHFAGSTLKAISFPFIFFFAMKRFPFAPFLGNGYTAKDLFFMGVLIVIKIFAGNVSSYVCVIKGG